MKKNQYELADYRLQGIEVRLKLEEGKPLYSTEPILSPKDAVRVMTGALAEMDREYLCVVNLDGKCKPINYNIIGIGTINTCPVEISNVFKSAILANAGSIIMLHSHPSGDVTPSKHDIMITAALIKASRIMNIPLEDHIIIGGGSGAQYSFREQTDMFKKPEAAAVWEEIIGKKNNTERTVMEPAAKTAGSYHVEKKGETGMEEKTMNFEEFRGAMKDALHDRIVDAEIQDAQVNKLQGESYRGIMVKENGSTIGVNISLETAYREYLKGADLTEMSDKMAETALEALDKKALGVDLEDLKDYSVMKDNLMIQVVNAKENADMLSNIPYKKIEDLAEICRIDVSGDTNSGATILVTDDLLKHYGVTKEQLFEDAEKTAPEKHPLSIRSMASVIEGITGEKDIEEHSEMPLVVATNENGLLGAGVIAYPEFMEKASEAVGGDFFLLPSSIHEVLVMKDDGEQSIATLEDMVRSVNESTVEKADQLSDSVYHFDSREKVFELAEKFEERHAAREEEIGNQKDSVLGDLGKKRRESFRAEPKLAESAGKYKGEEL